MHLWSSKILLANMLKTSAGRSNASSKCKDGKTSRETHLAQRNKLSKWQMVSKKEE